MQDKKVTPGFDFPGGCTLVMLYLTFGVRAFGIPTLHLSQKKIRRVTISVCKKSLSVHDYNAEAINYRERYMTLASMSAHVINNTSNAASENQMMYHQRNRE